MRFLWAFFLILVPTVVFTEAYTSSNFTLLDPVIVVEAGRSSSVSFEYYSSTGQNAIGESSSGEFTYRSGFLYFPTVSTPIVSSNSGNAQVILSWTPAIADDLGFTVAGYQVGQSTVSGGPYSFTTVGAVFTSTRTGLNNNTTYYFVIRALDTFGNVIATSTQVSATPAGTTTGGGGGGGGGGGVYTPPASATGVTFSGRAYPNRAVTLLKDGQVAVTTIAGPDARFEVGLTGLSAGSFLFALYSEDSRNVRSDLVTIPVSLTAGATTYVSGIFIAPTIEVDKLEVKRGETIAIFGQSVPESEITISVHSGEEFLVKTPSDSSGVYLLNFDTTKLEFGDHATKSRATVSTEVSPFGKLANFKVGAKTVLMGDTRCGKADMNCDGKVNLVDFSIVAYWYKRPLSSSFTELEKIYLNGDGKITIVDFSIMAYYWTG